MLIMRGARINVMNRGDDTPLHLASSHGHRDIVAKVHTLTRGVVTSGPGACVCLQRLRGEKLAFLFNFLSL